MLSTPDSFYTQYTIEDCIGRGAQGAVYKVRENDAQEIRAAKFISLAGITDWAAIKKMEREMRVLQSLDHLHIPHYYGFFQEQDRRGSPEYVLVMEYINGHSLSPVTNPKRYTETELQFIKEQTLDALAHAHTRGIIHRDLKPANLIQTSDGKIYVMDFGLAKLLGQETKLSSTGVGTIVYMSPEQINGGVIGPETDYYGLGLTLIALACGKERTDDYRHEKPLEQVRKLTHLSSGFRESLEWMVAEDPAVRRKGVEVVGLGEIVVNSGRDETKIISIEKGKNEWIVEVFFDRLMNYQANFALNRRLMYMGGSTLIPQIYFAGGLEKYFELLNSSLVTQSLSIVGLGSFLLGAVGLGAYGMDKLLGSDSENKKQQLDSPKRIAGSYEVMPQQSTYAKEVHALREACEEREFETKQPEFTLPDLSVVYRPLTFAENIWARLEAYESGDKSLFDTWLDSCTGIVYKAGTTRFKIIPVADELIGIEKDFTGSFLSVDYDALQGSEFDSSRAKYNTPLTKKEIVEHPGWLAAVEGDKALLHTYTDIVFAAYAAKYSKTDKLMGFYVRQNTDNDELRAVFVRDLDGNSVAGGNDSLIYFGRFLRR